MHAPEWIALLSPTLVLAGAALGMVAKLTRLTVVVEQLGKDIGTVVGRVDKHEIRIDELERHARGRHRYR